MKNVVFIGASVFGHKCLTELMSLPDINVCGVVTAPQTFQISYNKDGVKNVLHADMSELCKSADIPVAVITSEGMKDDDLFKAVQGWKPDFFVVCGWYHMVPKKWRDLAPAYGLHASLLPAYSGGAPLVWAIINGEKETGISFFQFDEGVDSGVIVGQARTDISSEDTIATLYARIEQLGLDLVRQHVSKLANDTAEVVIQDESKRTTFPQRSPADGLIDWNQSATRIYDFVRAQTKPYPGAFTMVGGKKLSIWAVDISNDAFGKKPGEFVITDSSISFVCSDGALRLKEVSVEGIETVVSEAIETLKDLAA